MSITFRMRPACGRIFSRTLKGWRERGAPPSCLPTECQPEHETVADAIAQTESPEAAFPETGKAGRVRVALSDFGPIARAEIEIRPLTVLAGPSNTGKSHLSKFVYSLHKSFREACPGHRPHGGLPEERRDSLTAEEGEQLAEWLGNCSSALDAGSDRLPPYPTIIRDRMASRVNDTGGFGNALQANLLSCFGVERLQELTRDTAENCAGASASIPGESTDAHVGIRIGPKIEARVRAPLPLDRALPGSVKRLHSLGCLDAASKASTGRAACELASKVAGQLVRDAFAPLAREPHYLPASRTGIMDAHRVFPGALAAQEARRNAQGSGFPGFAGVTEDLLRKLSSFREAPGPYDAFASEIERGILGGRIAAENAGGPEAPTFTYLPHQANGCSKIPLSRASSMVSEMAPVVLHLRHAIREGDLLIFEEPETHLHPAAQARLAVQLARLARAGLTVIVSTHSEWMMERFSTLVGISRLSDPSRDSVVESYPHLSGGELGPEEFGMWLFALGENRGGSTVTEVGFNSDGTDFSIDFAETNDDLYNEWAQVVTLLEEEKAREHA